MSRLQIKIRLVVTLLLTLGSAGCRHRLSPMGEDPSALNSQLAVVDQSPPSKDSSNWVKECSEGACRYIRLTAANPVDFSKQHDVSILQCAADEILPDPSCVEKKLTDGDSGLSAGAITGIAIGSTVVLGAGIYAIVRATRKAPAPIAAVFAAPKEEGGESPAVGKGFSADIDGVILNVEVEASDGDKADIVVLPKADDAAAVKVPIAHLKPSVATFETNAYVNILRSVGEYTVGQIVEPQEDGFYRVRVLTTDGKEAIRDMVAGEMLQPAARGVAALTRPTSAVDPYSPAFAAAATVVFPPGATFSAGNVVSTPNDAGGRDLGMVINVDYASQIALIKKADAAGNITYAYAENADLKMVPDASQIAEIKGKLKNKTFDGRIGDPVFAPATEVIVFSERAGTLVPSKGKVLGVYGGLAWVQHGGSEISEIPLFDLVRYKGQPLNPVILKSGERSVADRNWNVATVGDYTAKSGAKVQIVPNPDLDAAMSKAFAIIKSKIGLDNGVPVRNAAERDAIFQTWLKYVVPEFEQKDGSEYGSVREKIIRDGGGVGDLGKILAAKGAVCRELSIMASLVFSAYGIPSNVVSGTVGKDGGHAWIEINTEEKDRSKRIVVDSNYVKSILSYDQYHGRMKSVPLKHTNVANIKIRGNPEAIFRPIVAPITPFERGAPIRERL